MLRRLVPSLAGTLVFAACASGPPVAQPAPAQPIPSAWLDLAPAPRLRAAAWRRDGDTLWLVRESGERCSVAVRVFGGLRDLLARDLPFCPDRLRVVPDGSAIAAGERESVWLDEKLDPVTHSGDLVLDALSPKVYIAAQVRGGARLVSEDAVAELPRQKIEAAQLAGNDSFVYSSDGKLFRTRVRAAGAKAAADDQIELTQPFAALGTFDVSRDRGEVVFAAKRAGNFDIGLVSTDGSPIHWVPEDPADESDPVWAPSGNKLSYLVHLATGDLVRTVHVPTATQLTVPFEGGRIRSLAWDPKGERYAVVWSSPDSSDRVEVATYGGKDRHTVIPAAIHLDVQMDPLPGGVALAPTALRYNEKLPVTVWIVDDALVWNDGAGTLLQTSRSGAILRRDLPDAAFWTAVRKLAWIDPARIYVVDARRGSKLSVLTPESGMTLITARGGSPAPAEGTFRMARDASGARIVRLPPSTSPAVVESFAAHYVADQLKGTTPSNGNR
jgi:hypothetical protein